MYHGTRDRRRVQTDSAKGAGSLRVSPWYFRTTFRDRPRNTQCSNATEINSTIFTVPLPALLPQRLKKSRGFPRHGHMSQDPTLCKGKGSGDFGPFSCFGRARQHGCP